MRAAGIPCTLHRNIHTHTRPHVHINNSSRHTMLPPDTQCCFDRFPHRICDPYYIIPNKLSHLCWVKLVCLVCVCVPFFSYDARTRADSVSHAFKTILYFKIRLVKMGIVERARVRGFTHFHIEMTPTFHLFNSISIEFASALIHRSRAFPSYVRTRSHIHAIQMVFECAYTYSIYIYISARLYRHTYACTCRKPSIQNYPTNYTRTRVPNRVAHARALHLIQFKDIWHA